MDITGSGRRLASGLAVIALAGCTGNENPPASARVVVETSAEAETPLTLIVSTRFQVVASGEIVFENVDTIDITENYTELFALNSAARFTAKLLNQHETERGVRLAVLLDEGVEYDERATLAQNGFLQYVYRFQQRGIF